MLSFRMLKKLRGGLARLLTFFLLALYAVGSLQVESFHRLLHGHDDIALHSVEQEQNDCHRAVFHNQAKGDCKHKSHVTENKKCPLCQISTQQLHVVISYSHETFSLASEESSSYLQVFTPQSDTKWRADRAPPFLS
ncbi:MAG: hypothetical protein ACOYW3_10795 [Bacteroidota bacterium]